MIRIFHTLFDEVLTMDIQQILFSKYYSASSSASAFKAASLSE